MMRSKSEAGRRYDNVPNSSDSCSAFAGATVTSNNGQINHLPIRKERQSNWFSNLFRKKKDFEDEISPLISVCKIKNTTRNVSTNGRRDIIGSERKLQFSRADTVIPISGNIKKNGRHPLKISVALSQDHTRHVRSNRSDSKSSAFNETSTKTAFTTQRRRHFHDKTTRHYLKEEICSYAKIDDEMKKSKTKSRYNSALQYAIEAEWSSPKRLRFNGDWNFVNLPQKLKSKSKPNLITGSNGSGYEVSSSLNEGEHFPNDSILETEKSQNKENKKPTPVSSNSQKKERLQIAWLKRRKRQSLESLQVKALVSPMSSRHTTAGQVQPTDDKGQMQLMDELQKFLRTSKKFSQHLLYRKKKSMPHLNESCRRLKSSTCRIPLKILLPTRHAEVDFTQYGYIATKVLAYNPGSHTHVVRSFEDDSLWVAKCVNLTKMSAKESRLAMLEVKYLQQLQHPFILKFKESFITDNYLIIITEYCSGGDLLSYLKNKNTSVQNVLCNKCNHWVTMNAADISSISTSVVCAYCEETMQLHSESLMSIISSFIFPSKIIKWTTQLALGLQYMHSQKILHCDLKTSNIFLTGDHTAKIGDFGIARDMYSSSTYIARGTPNYMSPELYQGCEVTDKADAWALGCILYEMVFNRHAFEHHSSQGDPAVSYTSVLSGKHVADEIENRLVCIQSELSQLKKLIKRIIDDRHLSSIQSDTESMYTSSDLGSDPDQTKVNILLSPPFCGNSLQSPQSNRIAYDDHSSGSELNDIDLKAEDSVVSNFSMQLIHDLLHYLLQPIPENRFCVYQIIEILYSAEFVEDDQQIFICHTESGISTVPESPAIASFERLCRRTYSEYPLIKGQQIKNDVSLPRSKSMNEGFLVCDNTKFQSAFSISPKTTMTDFTPKRTGYVSPQIRAIEDYVHELPHLQIQLIHKKKKRNSAIYSI